MLNETPIETYPGFELETVILLKYPYHPKSDLYNSCNSYQIPMTFFYRNGRKQHWNSYGNTKDPIAKAL